MHEYSYLSDEVICAFAEAAGEDAVALTEPMAQHTTFQIGGPADVVISPHTPQAVERVLDICAIAGVPVVVVGNGSDILVGDRGFRGAVVLLRDNYAGIEVAGTRVHAQAGALLRDVALAAADAGLTGMEALWGIPASVGGACFMNAGAYDAATSDVLESVEVYVPGPRVAPDGTHEKGTVKRLRWTSSRWVTARAALPQRVSSCFPPRSHLAPGNEAQIRASMDDYQRRREEKQPLELPSAGSTFKRPQGYLPASSSWMRAWQVRAWAVHRYPRSIAGSW